VSHVHFPPAGTHACQANLVAAWSVWDDAMLSRAGAIPFLQSSAADRSAFTNSHLHVCINIPQP